MDRGRRAGAEGSAEAEGREEAERRAHTSACSGRDCVKSLRPSYTGLCVKSLRSSFQGLWRGQRVPGEAVVVEVAPLRLDRSTCTTRALRHHQGLAVRP